MKTVAVIGLGKFGFYIAKSLSRLENRVIAIDNNEQRVQEIANHLDNAYILDSTNKAALEDAGIVNLDTVIVSIGENLEASILTVMALKDLGNQNIIAKAITTTHGEILAKIGVSKVIHPEKIAGRMLIHSMINNIEFEKIDLSNSMRIMKFRTPPKLIGSSIEDLQKNYAGIKCISYKTEGEWFIDIEEKYIIQESDVLACIGDSSAIESFYNAIAP